MKLSRRDFFKTGAAAGGGIAVGMYLGGCGTPPLPHNRPETLQANAFLQVRPDGRVIFQLPRAEMGQGVYTGLTTLVAEELNMPPASIIIEHAYPHPAFRDPEFNMMMTGGSVSIRNNYTPLRQAAADLATWLRQAAAVQTGVEADSLTLVDGEVVDRNGEAIAFAALVETAKTLKPRVDVPLKPAAEFRFIGEEGARLDARAKVTGEAVFGIDCNMEGALTAVMRRCPHLGGRVKRFNADAARDVEGVEQVFEVNGAVAVVAGGYWPARKAADKLDVEWDKGPLAGLDDTALEQHQRQILKGDEFRNVVELGEASAAAGETLQAEYAVPFLAHSPMEPPNALVHVQPGKVEIWTGTQVPDTVVGVVAAALDRPREQIIVHNQMLGGGFGRRLVPDYIVEAALIAQRAGKPVKLIWSREDDTQHDYYRPAARVALGATIDGDRVTSFTAKAVVPSIMGRLMPMYAEARMPEWLPPALPRSLAGLARHFDTSMSEGLGDTNYRFPYIRVDVAEDETPVPVGFWRSVGHSQNAFFTESFMDELAHKVGRDPVAFRLAHMPEDSRRYRVLERVASLAWGRVAPGQFQGVAAHDAFHSSVAQVVNASVSEGNIQVHKVTCVVDCGLAVNPDIVRAQMESAVVFGLTAALKGAISFEDGKVMQSNFHDYPMLQLAETPEIEVHILPSEGPPTGVGEPGLPPVAPALANAVFAATGQRLRSLPLRVS